MTRWTFKAVWCDLYVRDQRSKSLGCSSDEMKVLEKFLIKLPLLPSQSCTFVENGSASATLLLVTVFHFWIYEAE
jgi:hypothetical protein